MDGSKLKLKNQCQHPGEHNKHEDCPKHRSTSWMQIGSNVIGDARQRKDPASREHKACRAKREVAGPKQ
jgi:hypothetical protein